MDKAGPGALGPESDLAMLVGEGVVPLDEESAWALASGQKVAGAKLDASGFSARKPALRIPAGDLVGAHVNGNRLRLVAYTTRSTGFLFTSTRLVRQEVDLVVVGKGSTEEGEALAQQWCSTALSLMGRNGPDAAKSLLVLINPMSGPKISLKMWKTIGTRVIVQDAGHKVDVVVTERQNHALELVKREPDLCAKYRGIVIVSGDGLIHEVLQGIMARQDWARCVQHLPIGVLPAGSGNGLAKTIAAAAGMEHSALSAAVLVARGLTRPLDIAAVDIYKSESDVKRVYSFLSLEWAISSDIDIGSEYLRWMGETRFTVQALIRVMFLRKYRGRLSYLPVGDSPKGQPRSAKAAQVQVPPTYWDEHRDQVDATAAPSPPTPLLPAPGSALPSNWSVVEGTFWNMWNCNVAWMSGGSCVAPDAEFDDGYLQMQFMREGGAHKLSRWRLLKYLLGLDAGEHQAMPFVEMTPSRAYRFEPLPDASGKMRGTLALDGEVVDYTSLQMQNLRGFMRVFAMPAPRPVSRM